MNNFINDLQNALGNKAVLTDPGDKKPFETDWRGLYQDEAVCVILPRSTDEVAKAVRICAVHSIKIVPQAGNSGLSGASTPVTTTDDGEQPGAQAVLSVQYLDDIEEIDIVSNTMTVGAGCILENIQNAALAADRFFPLNLGARGSCRIGGNISTNAGGVNVLAYGNTRALVAGLEAVLPDGRIWNGMSKLQKDNTGFDLKHLFIGGEGLLGVITKAVIKIFPNPKQLVTVFSALPSPAEGLACLNRLKSASQGILTSIELLPRVFIEQGQKVVPGLRDPFDEAHAWYLLTEHSLFGDVDPDSLTELYGELLEDGLLLDATIAQSSQQAADLWNIREGTTETQSSLGASIKHDVSVPVALVPELIKRGYAALEALVPDCRPVPFGHMGDGNLHFNVCQPVDMEADDFRARTDDINRTLHDIVVELDGSISAEHGIGRLRRSELARTKDPVELDMMRAVKAAFDPQGLMNPGKTL